MRKFYCVKFICIVLFLVCIVFPQSDFKAVSQKATGIVRIVILQYNDVFSDEKDEKIPYSLSLVSNGSVHKIKHIARSDYQTKNDLGMIYDFFRDEYEITLPPALYKLTIDGWDFEFSRFWLGSNTVARFEIPDNILMESVCEKNERFAKSYSSEEGIEAGRKRYASAPYHEAGTDDLTLLNSLNLVVRYCGKRTKKQKIIYRGTLISYSGDIFYAPKVVLDEKNNRLTLFGTKEEPIILTFEGQGFKIVEFDLTTGKIIRAKEFGKG